MDRLSSLPNLLILLDTGCEDWQAAAALLRKAALFRLLYPLRQHRLRRQGALRRLGPVPAGPRRLHGVLPAGGVLSRHRYLPVLHTYVETARSGQKQPLMLLDYYQDILLVDGIISESPRYLELFPDGQAAAYTGRL